MAEYNYGQGYPLRNDFNYTGEEDWYNYDNAPPTGIQYPGGNPVYPRGTRFDPAQGNIPYAPEEKRGINFPSILGGVKGGIEWLGEKFKRPAAKQTAYDAIMGSRDDQGWGTYKGNQYNIQDGKIYSEVNPFGKNFDSAFGSKSLEEMDDKTLSWAMDRLAKGKAISSRLRNILTNRGMLTPTNVGRAGQDKIPLGPISMGGTTGTTTGGGYTGPPTMDFNRAQAVKAGSYDRTAGPMSGSYGPWKAEGGRVGYQDGELVEDEYMAEATPRGMMEENIEEVQGEPSREQLEAIALEIFRLPLEELNEEQLNVVYQAAMEQEPAEEEIQFAAQEGPGEGIASLV
jgi:hypothetical protein